MNTSHSHVPSGPENGAPSQRPSAGWKAANALPWLTRPGAHDHKVSRGVLGARIGSAQYPGAAVLGVSAAWRTGSGMVRFVPVLGDAAPGFGLPTPAAAVLAARPETLFGDGTCDAWLLGSGTDSANRSAEESVYLAGLHQGEVPLVVDAGALDTVLTRDASSAPAVLTPHLGEFRRLSEAVGLGGANVEDAEEVVVRLAKRLNATVLLKGSTSIVSSPQGNTFTVGPATPWLATAGTGDVLAGILGALVAHHALTVCNDPELLAALAATAALVHDVAARIASGDDAPDPEFCVGSPIVALDIAQAVPQAIRQLNSVIRLEG